MGSAKPVDLNHLAKYTGGERAITEEVLRLFLSTSAEGMQNLEKLLAANGVPLPKDWRETAHTLKGSARSIGAFALADAAAVAETSGADQRAAIAALTEMKTRCAAVHAYINDYLRGQE